MKGLILSGGHGTRLRPLTYSQQKQLIPVANKSVLFYAIDYLIDAGIKDIAIIVGPNKEQVMDTVKSTKWDANIEFIYQDVPRGLAHAVKISKEFLGDDKFIMILGDNLLKGGIKNFANEFANSSAAASLLLTRVDNPEQYGLALIDEQKKVIVKLLEKPKNPPTNLSIVGIYGLTSAIFKAIDNIKPSWRKELEITDTLQWLIDDGYKIEYKMVEGWWKDTGKTEDILDANRLVLEDLKIENNGEVENSIIRGRVNIGKDSVIKNSTVKGPVIIGEKCNISDAYIGPYTSIGNNCQMVSTEIEDSIVMDGTEIKGAGRIVESLIGRDVIIRKNNNPLKGQRFIIGDKSEMII